MSDDYQSRTEKNKDKHQKSNRLFSRSQKNEDGKKQKGRSSSTFDKIFYILIALLFLVLIAFVIFIMNYSDGRADNVSEDLVQTEITDSIRDLFSRERNDETDGESDETASEDQEESADEANDDDGTNDEDDQDQDEDADTEGEGDLSIINENPPHDPSYQTDYSDGSADRLEIRENVMTVTGIPEGDLIENWIGNDGPGRVEATVTQASTGQQFVVYLQYGEGSWHVESVNPQ